MRSLKPAIASLANLVGLGLGYIYVGRIRAALLLFFCLVGIVALASWSGLIFDPVGIYIVVAAVVLVGLFPFVHCLFIAIREKSAPKKFYNVWWFYALWIIVPWVLNQNLLDARSVLFGYEPFNVPSTSMSPTLQQGDFIMVDTWSFKESGVEVGDIFVFTLNDEFGSKYVKRIIGLPGDTIELNDGRLLRNGQVVIEPHIAPRDSAKGYGRDFSQVLLGEEHYYVLGDNRAFSRDSRYLGPISEEQLHGKVRLRWFSYDNGVRWDRFPFVFDKSD